MKNILFFISLFITLPLLAQQRGASLFPSPQSKVVGTTRAVVVGISDYQDPAIPDLQFAHRDAEAFAAWLQSPAGGSVPPENIQLLLNEKATQAQVAMALTALMQRSKADDEAIIYFSGHGDVERITVSQPGFLLCWDAPATVYYAGGTLQLGMVQEIVSTLSLQNKARVLMITDACHAGRLAGSEVGGPQATTQNLARQFANEVKILSCQPNEFSLEGTQWGGGRGCFSYHLTDGLYGLADRNEDDLVTLVELENYLEDHVPEETAPHPQFPFTVGDKLARVARVDAPTLARIKVGKSDTQPSLDPIDPRGMETWVLARADSSILELYAAFNAALERKELLEPKGKSANDYYERLIREPELEPLHGLMTRNFAAALLDESQQVTNKLLKTDPQVVSDAISRPFVFDHIHTYIARAIELLGDGHFLYKHLKAKQCYFEAKTYRAENYPDWPADSLNELYMSKLQKGLQLDSTAAYIYLEMAMNFTFVNYNFEYAIQYGKKAIELSPRSAAAHFFVGNAYNNIDGAGNESKRYLEKSMSLDSTFLPTYIFLGLHYGYAGNYKKYIHFLEKYVQSVQALIRADSNAVPVFYYNQLGNVLWKLGRIDAAEAILLEAEKRSEGKSENTYVNLAWIYFIRSEWGKMILVNQKRLEITPGNASACLFLGFGYQILHQDSLAEATYKHAIRLAADDSLSVGYAYRLLGDFYLAKGRRADAEMTYQQIIDYYPNFSNPIIMNYVGRAEYVLHGRVAMEQIINRFIQENPENGMAYQNVACLYALAGLEKEALEWLDRTLIKFPGVYWSISTDLDLYPLNQSAAFKALMKKYMPEGEKD